MSHRVIITDKIDEGGVRILEAADVAVTYRPGITKEELLDVIDGFDGLIISSSLTVGPEIIERGTGLKVIGRAGVGLDNVDVAAASRRGILVVNTPEANTISTTEHTLALMLGMVRNLPRAHASLTAGEWNRGAFTGSELYGKTLGVIGLGRIGSQVAKRARAFGMKVVAFDEYITPRKAEALGVTLVDLPALLAAADFITVHAPLTEATRGMIGTAEVARMKDGVFLVNCARGGIYQETALLEGLQAGKIRGLALDVFETEPPGGNPLLDQPQVVVTPHLGAKTAEARARIAQELAEEVKKALLGTELVQAVNLPFREDWDWQRLKPFLDLGERLGACVSQLLGGRVQSLAIEGKGSLADKTSVVTAAVMKGVLERSLEGTVNVINAMILAEERGIAVTQGVSTQTEEFVNEFSVTGASDQGTATVAGTLLSDDRPRIVEINGYRLEVRPRGHLLVIINEDLPGVVGKVGSLFGSQEINIGEYHLCRQRDERTALSVINLDAPLPAPVLEELRHYTEIRQVFPVTLEP